ncbi:MAG: hypothetical protein ACOCYG_04305 [Spirochaetota bacterium]
MPTRTARAAWQDTFQKVARQAKEGCPVSKALAGVDIQLEAKLQQPKQ